MTRFIDLSSSKEPLHLFENLRKVKSVLRNMKLCRSVGVLLFFSLLPIVQACCLAYGTDPMSLIDEKAIIVWNPKTGTEHFIRQASFEGKAKDFGFIVPTPSQPQVEKADAAAFERLQRLVPKPSTRGMDSASTPTAGFGGVEILEQKRVGDYFVTVLRATDGSTMLTWLKDNGYQSRPAMEKWLDHYAKQQWYFAALKFVREPESQEPKTTAVRVSFQTKVPHYPYKMPEDTWPAGHVRPVALYFVGPGAATAVYRDGKEKWEAQRVWSGALPDPERAGLAKELNLKLEDIPAGATVTVMRNSHNEHGYDRDLDFNLAPAVPTIALVIWGIAGLAMLYTLIRMLFVPRKSEVATPAPVA